MIAGIGRIEIGVRKPGLEIEVLIPVVLHELAVLVINPDPDQNLVLDILADYKPVAIVARCLVFEVKPDELTPYVAQRT